MSEHNQYPEAIEGTIYDSDSNPDTSHRSKKWLARTAFATAGLMAVGVGVAASFTEKMEPVTEMSVQGGEATVKEIYRDHSEFRAIGFLTEVDGVTAENRLTNRKLANGVPLLNQVPLPDIVASARMDDYYVSSDLCMPAGKKEMTETVIDGKTHIEYIIDPADISVCSAEAVKYTPLIAHDGNWIENLNNADNDISRLFDNNDNVDTKSTISKENAKKSELEKLMKNAALLTVNEECGPQVFDETKEDFLELVENDIRRDNEVVTVKFKADADGSVAIDGTSELNKYFEDKKASEDDQIKYSYDAGEIVGSCEIAPEAAEVSND